MPHSLYHDGDYHLSLPIQHSRICSNLPHLTGLIFSDGILQQPVRRIVRGCIISPALEALHLVDMELKTTFLESISRLLQQLHFLELSKCSVSDGRLQLRPIDTLQ